MSQNHFRPAIYTTYMVVIKNSVGSRLFRSFFVFQDDKKHDVLKNGKLACAFFVSSILRMFNLITKIHSTVISTVKDMQKNSWKNVKKPQAGDVIVWECDKSGNQHIGFYLGKGYAVSNSSTRRYPIKHNWKFNGERKVIQILRNNFTSNIS